MTVTGPKDSHQLGVTLAHEHLFIDIRNQFTEFQDPEQRRLSHESLRLDNLGVVRRNPYAIRDNLLLNDFGTAVNEMEAFKKAGGRSVVDCTSVGILRDPKNLRALAQEAGVNIIAGCGYYTVDTHPARVAQCSCRELANEMIHDLRVGMDGTDIRAGVIGEIGTSNPIHPDEKKSLQAAALAQVETGAGVQVHTYPWGQAGLEAADTLVAAGVEPRKVAICHIDVEINLEYICALLDKGVLVEFDNFGKEFYIDPAERGFAGGIFARDLDRVRAIKQLVERGYGKQILVTNDICLKCMLHAYGGWGYDHILRNIVPMMLDEGINETSLWGLLKDNPQHFLESDCRD